MRPTCCPQAACQVVTQREADRGTAPCRAWPRRRAPRRAAPHRGCPGASRRATDLPEAELVERLLAHHQHGVHHGRQGRAERCTGERELDGSGALAPEARHGIHGHGRDSGTGEGEPDVARRRGDAEREEAEDDRERGPGVDAEDAGVGEVAATPCMAAPARPRASPTARPVMVRGTRDCTTRWSPSAGSRCSHASSRWPAARASAPTASEQAAEHEHHPTGGREDRGGRGVARRAPAGRAAGAAGRTPGRSRCDERHQAWSAAAASWAGRCRAPRAGSAAGGRDAQRDGLVGVGHEGPGWTAGIWPSSGSLTMASRVVASGTHVRRRRRTRNDVAAPRTTGGRSPWCSG